MDMTTFLRAMISVTMSRISSRAVSVSSLTSCDRSIASMSAPKIMLFVW